MEEDSLVALNEQGEQSRSTDCVSTPNKSTRCSARLRNKSAKGEECFKHPDYIYEDFRTRASSWSSFPSKEVRKRDKYKKPEVSTGPSMPNVLSPRKDKFKSDINAFRDKQQKLRQQRIDLLFDRDSEPFKLFPQEEGLTFSSVHRAQTVNNLNTASTENDNTQLDTRYLQSYGSDYDTSVNADITVEPFINDTDVNYDLRTKEDMAEGGKDVVPASENSTVRGWSDLLGEMRKEIKAAVTEAIDTVKAEFQTDLDNITAGNAKVSTDIIGLNEKYDQLNRDLTATCNQLKTQNLQLVEVIGCTVKQDQELSECKAKIEMLQTQLDKDTLKIRGIIEEKEEKCDEVVKKFFAEQLGISEEIEVKDAFRIGRGRKRTIVVKLSRP